MKKIVHKIITLTSLIIIIGFIVLFFKYNQYSINDYNNLVSSLTNEFKLDGYKLENSSFGEERYVIIDKESSFGKRKFMTLSGENNTPSEITQHRNIYLADDEKTICVIDIIFSPKYIGNDMMLWSSNYSDKYKNHPIISMFKENIISYENYIIKTMIFPNDEVKSPDVSVLRDITNQIVIYLEKYNP